MCLLPTITRGGGLLTVALFPGQGVQAPAMDAGLAAGEPEIFALASEVLGADLAELCREGASGEADLGSTRWAQPAVLLCSVAAFRKLGREGEPFDAAVGHSVGEYASLVASEALHLADALRLVALRAEVMEDAARRQPGGMAAVMRIEREALEAICAEAGISVAADNGPGQLVVSGTIGPLEQALEAADRARAVTRRLDIAGAFHSPVMAPAVPAFADALADVPLVPPTFAVWSPTTAGRIEDPSEIRDALVAQFTGPVRWRETIEAIAANHEPEFVDCGPGKVVGGLVKRLVKPATIRFAADVLGAPRDGAYATPMKGRRS